MASKQRVDKLYPLAFRSLRIRLICITIDLKREGEDRYMKKKDRTGERFITNEGYIVEIVEYNNNKDLWIEFQDEYKAIVHTEYACCKNGQVKNPCHKSVYDVGYRGQGKYKSKINNKITEYYTDWHSMMVRCYSKKCYRNYNSYENCIVCEEWHNFQEFAKWWHNNYYEIEGETICLDKDILCKGNKIYSPDTCIFVPKRINTLFVKRDNDRGDYPIGVCYLKDRDKYEAYCSTLEGIKYIGLYNTPQEAFQAYKTFKEAYIKQVADEYKGRIPDKLYNAMYAWTVEIDD